MTNSNQCELCGYAINGKHYSLKRCNKDGLGVTLHKRCCERLESLASSEERSLILLVFAGR